MIKKNIVSFICLIVLSIQVVPVKQIGAILFGNQINEELVHTAESDGGKEIGKKMYKSDLYIFEMANEKQSAYITSGSYYHFSSLLPQNHAGDIQTPPPNSLG